MLYAQATEKSLQNAEQWIEDAKILINNSSFGHASALLRYACEELSKAFVCWAVSEKIYPIEHRIIQDVFKHHKIKNRVFVGFAISVKLLESSSKRKASSPHYKELSIDDFVKTYEWIDELTLALEKVRQKSIYVDTDFGEMKVTTPLSMSKKQVLNVMKGTETYLGIVKHYVEKFSEAKKKIFRNFISSVPRDVWNEKYTAKAVEWLKEVSGIDLSLA